MDANDDERHSLEVVLRMFGTWSARTRLVRAGFAVVVVSLIWFVTHQVAHAGLNAYTSAGPAGGTVLAVIMDPRTSGVLYAATGRGVFKSTTGGSFWTRASTGLDELVVGRDGPIERRITALTVDPQSPTTLYAGAADGIFKTTDGGSTWARSDTGIPDFPIVGGFGVAKEVFALAVDPGTPASVYALVLGSQASFIYKTTDGGGVWSRSDTGLTFSPSTLVIDPRTPTTLYVGAGDAIFKSTDSGASWAKHGAGFGLTGIAVTTLTIDPRTPETLYAGVVNFFSGSGIDGTATLLKSTDGGASWRMILERLDQTSTFTDVVIDPATPGIVYAGTSDAGTHKSTNAGSTWSTNGTGPSSVRALAIDPRTPSTLYAGTLGEGVFKSTDGGVSWGPSSAGMAAGVSVLALALNPQRARTLYAGLERGGVAKSTDGGASWRQTASDFGPSSVEALAVDPSKSTTIYAGTFGEGVFKSTDAGASWNRSDVGLEELGAREVVALVTDPKNPETLYAGTFAGVMKSTDGGASWMRIQFELAPFDVPINVNTIAIDLQHPTTLYVGNNQGVFKSTDGGATWNARHFGLAGGAVDVLVLDPKTPATLYAGVRILDLGFGVFKSIDGAASWGRIDAGYFSASEKISALAIDPRTPTTLYAGAAGAVHRSADGGATWTMDTFSPGFSSLRAIALNPTGSCVHTGGDSGSFSIARRLDGDCLPPPPLVAAVLPTSRSVRVGSMATAFASIANAGLFDVEPAPLESARVAVEGLTCGIIQLTGAPTPFTFQATDPTTNLPIGLPNAPVDIAGGATQSFMISLTPTEEIEPTEIRFGFNCSNSNGAPTIIGVNTLRLAASTFPTPDIIALAATIDNDGIVSITNPAGIGAFAVAAANVGHSGTITVSADTDNASLPITITICETNAATAECLAPPKNTVTRTVDSRETLAFGVFVTSSGPVPFEAANHRIFVRFSEGGITRGSTSVAVRTK